MIVRLVKILFLFVEVVSTLGFRTTGTTPPRPLPKWSTKGGKTSLLRLELSLDESWTEFSPREQQQSSSPIKTLESARKFVEEVDSAARDQLIIVFFHAYYCKLCQRSNTQYRKVAHRLDRHKLCFTRLETSNFTAEQLRALGVEKFPWFQIYRNGVCVANFAAKDALERKLESAIAICEARSTAQWLQFIKDFAQEIASNRRARNLLQIEPSLQGPLQTLTQATQLVQVIDEAPLDTLTVVLFHSHFSEACRHAQYQFRRIVDHYQGRPDIQFARIEAGVMDDHDLTELGAKGFPFVQMYRNQHVIVSFDTGPSYMFKRTVHNHISTILQSTNNAWGDMAEQSQGKYHASQTVLNRLRSQRR